MPRSHPLSIATASLLALTIAACGPVTERVGIAFLYRDAPLPVERSVLPTAAGLSPPSTSDNATLTLSPQIVTYTLRASAIVAIS